VSLTVSKIQAVLMLKTTFLPTPLVFGLEFESHAVLPLELWRRNLALKSRIVALPHGKEIMIVRSSRMGTVHEYDRRTDRFTTTKTALCNAYRRAVKIIGIMFYTELFLLCMYVMSVFFIYILLHAYTVYWTNKFA